MTWSEPIITRACASVSAPAEHLGRKRLATTIATVLTLLLWAGTARAQTFTLTVHVGGPNPGTVAVIGPGSLCLTPESTQCSVQIQSGRAIRLTADAPAGQVPGLFSGGTGPAAGCGLSTCSFTMTADADVTATFDPANGPTATITTTLAGDGTGNVSYDNGRCQNFDPVQYSSCAAVYLQGSVVTLDTAAAAGSRFSGFSAGTAGAAACGAATPCVFTMNSSAAVTATFHAITSIAVAPTTASKPVGQSQTFTANGTFSNGVTEPLIPGMGTWVTKTPNATLRFSLATAVANGKLYAIGGINNVLGSEAPSAIVEAYDPVANTWSSAASMPTPRESLAAVTVNGQIYAIGGNTPGSVPTGAVERYDPGTNTWTARASMPTPRIRLAAGVINGIVYAVGGQTAGASVGTVEAYDPVANTWTTRAAMPTAREFLAVGVVNGILYAVGGNAAGNPALATVEAYDPVANAWTTKASMPGASTTLAAAVIDGVLYAMGGSSGNTLSNMYQYDAARDAWSMKIGMPTARSEPAADAINGRIYVVGGHTTIGSTPFNKVEMFTDHLLWSSSAPAVANVSQQGQANAIAVGSATIRVAVGPLGCAGSCATFTVSSGVQITANPSNLRVTAGQLASFSAAASGTTTPLVQWQVSTDYGATFTNVGGAANTTLSFTAAQSDNGKQYRAVFTNASGSATTTAARLVVRRVGARTVGPDLDGDGQADLIVWRPASGTWYSLSSSSGYSYGTAGATQWGSQSAGDVPLTGDIDGDGVGDLIVWRGSTGTWYWLTSSTGFAYASAGGKQWGNLGLGDVPMVGDIDGDGRDDLIVWRASTGTWYWLTSSSGFSYGASGSKQWGSQSAGDMARIGDVDGDGKVDLLVWRGPSGTWYWLTSSSGYAYASAGAKQWGSQGEGDVPLVGDVDGDGKADLMVWRGPSGTWFWLTSSSGYNYGTYGAKQWGSLPAGDSPSVSDVDGDGKADFLVWRAPTGTWFWLTSSSGYSYGTSGAKQWGSQSNNDIPMCK